MKKKNVMSALAVLVLMLALPAFALADGAVLLVSLPDDAQMVENIEFDDGDFIQTYQLDGGVMIQLLRYASFDMTLDELAQSEWTGSLSCEAMDIAQIGGCPAGGLHLAYQEEGEQGSTLLDVYMVLVDAGDGALMFEAVVPQKEGLAQDGVQIMEMIRTMDVLRTDGGVQGGTEAEVG